MGQQANGCCGNTIEELYKVDIEGNGPLPPISEQSEYSTIRDKDCCSKATYHSKSFHSRRSDQPFQICGKSIS